MKGFKVFKDGKEVTAEETSKKHFYPFYKIIMPISMINQEEKLFLMGLKAYDQYVIDKLGKEYEVRWNK